MEEFECPDIVGFKQGATEMTDTRELDIFLDHCGSLYNLILDTLHNLTPKTISCEFLEEMTTKLELSAKQIVENAPPQVENLVLLRLNTICSAMEQLKVQQSHFGANSSSKNSCTESDAESLPASLASSPIDEMRSWLHKVEKQLMANEARLRTEANLHKILLDQQTLQLEIQRDGQFIVNHLNKELRDKNALFGVQDEKRKNTIDALTRKWHNIFLNSLSLVCRIEELINYKTSSDDCDSDPDLSAPPTKRLRIRRPSPSASESQSSEAEDEDTLPFAEDEYESIEMNSCETETTSSSSVGAISPSCSGSEKAAATVPRKWDSVQQDIGYSSGENSIHEAMNMMVTKSNLSPESSEMRRKRIECSPVKAFYRTVQLEDMSDLEVTKAINHDVDDEPNLSDSMYVNHDLSFNATNNLSEFDEVMALYDDSMLPTDLVNMSESFNTKWREIHGEKLSRRSLMATMTTSTTTKQMEKSSCDASSEDSSEGETNSIRNDVDDEEDLMNMSFNSVSFDTSSPLKRQRSGRGLRSSTFLLNTIDMNGSIYSTRSEITPNNNNNHHHHNSAKMRSSETRRKLRVRRMPRSMSDGEQLCFGGAAGSAMTMTPTIQVSPPRSTTQLLRKLDDDLRRFENDDEGSSSDNQQSDAGQQAYEWDEYNPPQKDDSHGDSLNNMTEMSSEFAQIDDDFSEHFGMNTTIRMIEESQSNLKIVKAALDDENLSQQMANFELIAKVNLRQINGQLKQQKDSEELRQLMAEWEEVYEQVCNPFARIMQQVKKFAITLQEVDTIATINDFANIETKEDISKALDNCQLIEKRLSLEREQLRQLIESKVFQKVARQISNEFGMVTDGYDEAIRRISTMTESLAQVKTNWDEMTMKNDAIRNTIVEIESQLKEGKLDTRMIYEEMELCQERMDNLETMCNYLTDSLVTLKQDNEKEKLPDFKKDLSIYSIALKTLKDRLSEIDRVPTPPIMMSEAISTQTMELEPQNVPIAPILKETVSSSRLIQILFILSIMFALAAICYYHIFSKQFGPHLEYVQGPPPF